MNRKLAKGIALTLATTMVSSVSAYAAETDNYYVKVTNEDGSDPVYVELTEDNSSSEGSSAPQINEDAKEEGKNYSDTIHTTSTDTAVYEIKNEITDVTDMESGTTYSFVTGDDAEDIKVGDVLTKAPDGGATLTYTGDGTTGGTSGNSVTDTFNSDKQMVQKTIDNISAAINADSVEDFATDYLTNYYTDYISKYWNDYYKYYYSTQEDAVTTFVNRELTYYSSYSSYYKSLYDAYNDSSLLSGYQAILDSMNTVNATSKESILHYTGLTEDEYLAKKAAWQYSNSPVVKNSGTVDVVESGKGFDNCKSGVIYYDKNLGWSYACTGGGVDFGVVNNMHLYTVNESTLSPDAFQVTAGDAVQLAEDGTGTVNSNNIKVTCTIGGKTSDVMTYDFIDTYVDLKDNHATVYLNGRYYTVSLNVLEYMVASGDPVIVQDETGDPVIVKAVNNAEEQIVTLGNNISIVKDKVVTLSNNISIVKDKVVTLSNNINQGVFGSIVKDKAFDNQPYVSSAEIENGTLKITAVAEDNMGVSELRCLVADEKFLNAIKDANVKKLAFTVGDYTLIMDTNQLINLSNIIITIDPVTGKCIISVDGVDVTANFIFTFEKAN